MQTIPLAHQPHHDGSALYVLNQSPQLLDRVRVRVRIHPAIGEVAEVRVRASESGEAFPSMPATEVATEGAWVWFETEITMHNPQVNYRWMIKLVTGKILWLNALGLHDLDQPDINDFRINTFSSAPQWGPGTILYEIFPDRFARSSKGLSKKIPRWAQPAGWGDEVIGQGPGTSEQLFGGDLWGVIEHLDHLQNLGVNTLYLTPIFPARSNHRYDASSFDVVDPLLGGNEAYKALIKAVHQRGMRIIGDLTSNHSGDAHEWFKKAYKNPKAPESKFYYFSNRNKTYDSWFGVPSLPKFNWNSKELRKRFIKGKSSVVAKWLRAPYNIDGWRIDVANMTGRIRDEDMYLEVAQIVRKTMVSVNPDTIMLGEYTGDAAYEVQGNGWQGAMTYANFTRPLFRWLQSADAKNELQNIGFISTPETGADFVESHRKFAAGFPWHVRLNNMNTLDTHDTPRFKTFTLPGAQKVAAAIQFTFPGIPMIWAGDEFGLDGFNGENSRTPIPWDDERPSDKSLIETYAQLAKIRRENIALTHGGLRFLAATAEAVVFVREHESQNILVSATRGRATGLKLPQDVVTNLDSAENLFGAGKIILESGFAKLPSTAMAVNIWRLPAAL
jgi:alpha-glucosidase